MAQALNNLAAGAPAAAAQAMAAASQAQAAGMVAGRSMAMVPGQEPSSSSPGKGGGAAFAAAAMSSHELPAAPEAPAKDWGRLPPKVAKDLMDAQREGVAGEYREQVDAYFRAIGEKAREQ